MTSQLEHDLSLYLNGSYVLQGFIFAKLRIFKFHENKTLAKLSYPEELVHF